MGRGAEVKGAGIDLGPGECAKTRLSVKSRLGGNANIAGCGVVVPKLTAGR